MPSLLATSSALDRRVLSFRSLQKAIGLLAISLPLVLVLGAWLSGHDSLQPSISHYYHTNLREFFVGILCAVSLFLLTYWGYEAKDRRLSLVAGLCCLGIAFFPTKCDPAFPDQYTTISVVNSNANEAIHYGSAVLFFGILAYMSFYLFTLSGKNQIVTARKKTRNRIFRAAGLVIVGCMLVGLLDLVWWCTPPSAKLTFIIEAIMLEAFGLAWIVKGQMFYSDKEP